MEIKGINSNNEPIIVEIEGSLIKDVKPYAPKEGEKLYRIFPGFINIHVHGGYLFDWTMPNKEQAADYLYKIAKQDGVTSVVGTMITDEPDKIFHAIDVQKDLLKESPGANLLGYHLEGPFISLEKKGAHDPSKILPMTVSLVERYIENVPEGAWKIWTYAPENNDVSYVQWMIKNGIVPSIGHSASHPKTAQAHIEAGAKSVTHFDNALTKIKEDPNGLAGYLLSNKDIYKEMIFDGIHVNHHLMQRVIEETPENKLMMVTDALHIAGMPSGTYENLNGTPLVCKNEVGYNSEGILNGSAKTYINEVKFAVKDLQLKPDYIEKITSTNQAELLGLNKGKIQKGYDADIILVDDDYNLIKTVVMGKEIN